jgi:hypothetical protein
MKWRVLTAICGFAVLLNGCQEVRREVSETLYEDAVIAEVVYTPAHHKSQLGISAYKTGPIGVDFGGNVGLRIGGGMQVSRVKAREKFAVVFECQHGQFIVSRKEVYEKLKDYEGRRVRVAYQEVYRTTYETTDGEKRVIARDLVDYAFLDAVLK